MVDITTSLRPASGRRRHTRSGSNVIQLCYYRSVSDEDERPRQVIHLRVEADLYDTVREYAARTRRSVNGAAIYLIEQGLRVEGERE